MKSKGQSIAQLCAAFLIAVPCFAQPAKPSASYAIGPGDQLTIWALGIDETNTRTVIVDPDGCIDLPMIGRVKASGRSAEQLKAALAENLKTYVKEPEVSVSVSDYHSQPVSVVGAVKDPGVRELRGGKRLLEVLALAGGLTPDAGNAIYITRRKDAGDLNVPGLMKDESAESTTVRIPAASLLQAGDSEYNITIRPNDTIVVPRARMVYVMGEVNRPGGFVLNEREGLSVLQAISLAGGTTRTASSKNARILRPETAKATRTEITLNLKGILTSKAGDVELRPEDILFVPNSAAKSATIRALEAGIQISTGLIIWH